MKRTLSEVANLTIRLVVVFLLVLFGASCSDNNFIGGEEPSIEEPEQPETPAGDTLIVNQDFMLHHGDWSYSNGLATADHYFEGFLTVKVGNEPVSDIDIEHENAPMSISWEPIEETTSSSAEKMYIGQAAGEAKKTESHQNQKINFTKYERECKLEFVGMELTLTGEWYEASFNKADTIGCRYDSTTVATQRMDTVKVDGTKVEVEMNGTKYNRVNVTAKAENHFTDLPAGTTHKEQMDIEYSVLVPVIFVPGEKFYEGSIAGNGSYVKASAESYRSSLELTHIFTQDGAQIKEQETVSGTAVVRTWVETAGPKMIVPSIEIGNPTVSVSTSVSDDFYQKEGNIYAKMYKTTWTYTWANGFSKKVYSEVERLYYRREAGKEVAMPYGETSTSFKNFNAGSSVEKSENDKKYDAYPNGVVSFNGAHKSTTGNVNDQIAGLSVGQEFWVEKEAPKDEFLGFDKEIIAGNNNQDAQIIIIEHWSVSGDKEIVFSQSANYSFAVSEQQRVLGEALNFMSGLEKSTNNGKFNEVKENQFVRTISDTYVAKFNLCEVKAIAGYNEAYIEYRGERINFEFAEATVSYEGINNPTATEVTVDGKLFSRRSYEVSFSHNLLGEKKASVLVDKEKEKEPEPEPEPEDPTSDPEWGTIDIEKTRAFGRICVTWKEVAGQSKLQHFYSGTIVTTKGIISFSNGYSKFTAMDTNVITKEVGNGWDGANLNPAYITVSTNPNVSWQYYDVVSNELVADIHSSKMQTEGGINKEKPFVANGGQANVYNITENGNSVKVVITYNGEVLFSEVFAK